MVKQKTAYEMRSSDWISYVCSSDLPYCPLLAGRAASSTVMKRSTRSLTCNVDMPARSCSSSISKTDASSLPETRISASSSDVFTMSGRGRFGEANMCCGKLRLEVVIKSEERRGGKECGRKCKSRG